MTADPPLSFHIGLSARRSNSLGWGDTQYAVCLGRAFEAKGHRAKIFVRDETPALTGDRDVVLRIVGPHLDEPVAGVPNLLWIISPPNLAPRATLARFATVFSPRNTSLQPL